VDVTPLVEWTSADRGVAGVSSVIRPGWVTTLRPGTTTIGARLSGVIGTVALHVSTEGLAGLSISAPSSLQSGAGAIAVATATLSGGGEQRLDEDVIWSSDAPAILGVSNAPGGRGRLLALAPGTTTLRARTRAGIASLQASTVLTVSAPALHAPVPAPRSVR
jgi:hypothetical protein